MPPDVEQRRDLFEYMVDFFSDWRPSRKQRLLRFWNRYELRRDAQKLQAQRSNFRSIHSFHIDLLLGALERMVQPEPAIFRRDVLSQYQNLHSIRSAKKSGYSNLELESLVKFKWSHQHDAHAAFNEVCRQLDQFEEDAGAVAESSSTHHADHYSTVAIKRGSTFTNRLDSHWACECRLDISQYVLLHGKHSYQNSGFNMVFGLSTPIQQRKYAEAHVLLRGDVCSSSLATQAPVVPHLCNNIRGAAQEDCCLCIRLTDGWIILHGYHEKQFNLLESKMTLDEFYLSNNEASGNSQALPKVGRILLATSIAEGLAPFLFTSWMNQEWDLGNISFFWPENEDEYPSITKPHMLIVPRQNNQYQESITTYRIHPMPGILSFGQLLCELICSRSIFNRNSNGNPVTVNAQYNAVATTLEKIKENSQASDWYIKAIQSCLRWKLVPQSQNAAEVARKYQNEIIQPLLEERKCHSFENSRNNNREWWGPWGLRVMDLSRSNSSHGWVSLETWNGQ